MSAKKFQSMELDIVSGSLQFLCVGSLAGVTYLCYTVPMSLKKDETAAHCCDPALSVLVMIGVSKRLPPSVSLVAYCLSSAITQPRSQGPLSTSRKCPGYGWSLVR